MSEEINVSLEKKLRAIIETVDVANMLSDPIAKSIENFLHLTAKAMNSEEASVLIRDGDEGDLKFLIAVGKVAEHLINLKVPAGKGIAGFVFSSGQPMAVADVGEEDTFYAEVDKKTGYSTQTILATPLSHNGEIIGVLEYVNRLGEPPYEPFTPDEMDHAALYAEAVASMVNAYETSRIFTHVGDKILSIEKPVELSEVRDWVKNLRENDEHRKMIDLAILVREISRRGDDEREMCSQILESFLKYSNRQHETSFLSF
ncbi:MAG: GAF domain-containing protein [Pyrinomonadaceae bacterium]